MGRNVKIGKQRKDRFYKLAKETGFRSRASFKLIQLNRKFEFLQKARILIDLCAAPGGWLQVAQKSMPVSSLILGVDLVSIKPIQNVLTFQEDITTDKCRQTLKKQLKTWKADVVLHDGAPNVGKNWLHDAFAQAQLTLSALKLATEMLMKGGWFVTKVFRSNDYNALLWAFGKLFKKVHVTKPQASRSESAEIFVVCQGYLAPDRIDQRFLDPSHLFQDVDDKGSNKTNPLLATKRKVKAVGYEDGDASVINKLKASDFIFGDNHLEALSKSSEIIFDLDDISDHRCTTEDIKDHCKDLKVLGKAELRALLTWRKNIRAAVEELERNAKKDTIPENVEEDEEEKELEDAVKKANELELNKFQLLKRKKKKVLKEKRKTQEKFNLKMIIKDDEPIIEEDRELFNINLIKNKKDLSKLDENEGLEIEEAPEEEEEESLAMKYRSTYQSYDKHADRDEVWHDREKKPENDFSESEDEQKVEQEESENELEFSQNVMEEEEEEENPLLIDFTTSSERTSAINKWFDKEHLNEISDDDDDLDLELIAENIVHRTKQQEMQMPAAKKAKSEPEIQLDENGTKESDDEKDEEPMNESKENTAVVKEKKKKKRKVVLDPEGLALGAIIIRSKKCKRDIIDNAYNRYASNDTDLPDWFTKDEEKHNRKQMPVTAEMAAEYKSQLKEINARPLKKVVEAKSRKKRKALRKMEKARKRAEAVTDNDDMNDREKVEQLKSIYKKALAKKDTKVTYVVAKKGVGKQVRRPPGVKGRYKVVDKRMKKDDRKKKTEAKTPKKGRKPFQKRKKQR